MAVRSDDYPRLNLPGLLVCEGRDDKEFLGRMLGVMGIREGMIHIEQYAPRTVEAGGDSWITIYVSGLGLRPGFERVRSIGFVCDADRAPTAKLQSIRQLLRDTKLPVPQGHGQFASSTGPRTITVGVFIMPDGRRRGALEDLYLDAIEHESARTGDRAMVCVDRFLTCVDPRARLSAARRQKTRLHAWLSTRDDPTVRPGQALTREYFRSDCPPLLPIREFLRQVAQGAEAPLSD